jgi:hypothetical protein
MTTPNVRVGPIDLDSPLPGSIQEMVTLIQEVEWLPFTEEQREEYPMVEVEDALFAKYEDYELILAGNTLAIVTNSGLSTVYEMAINQVDYT